VLYDVVLQVATKRQAPWLNNYGSVWTCVWRPEAYGGKGKMHAIANLWWLLPYNEYDYQERCVGPRMNILSSTQPCLTNASSRNAMRGILPVVDAQRRRAQISRLSPEQAAHLIVNPYRRALLLRV
jgi:hypothetical protein